MGGKWLLGMPPMVPPQPCYKPNGGQNTSLEMHLSICPSSLYLVEKKLEDSLIKLYPENLPGLF